MSFKLIKQNLTLHLIEKLKAISLEDSVVTFKKEEVALNYVGNLFNLSLLPQYNK